MARRRWLRRLPTVFASLFECLVDSLESVDNLLIITAHVGRSYEKADA